MRKLVFAGLALLILVGSNAEAQARSDRCIPVRKDDPALCRVDTVWKKLPPDTVTKTVRDSIVRVDTLWRKSPPDTVVKYDTTGKKVPAQTGTSCWKSVSWCTVPTGIGLAGAAVWGVCHFTSVCEKPKQETNVTTTVTVSALRAPQGFRFGFNFAIP